MKAPFTQDELAQQVRISQKRDLLGFETHEYLEYLDVEHFREFARKDADLSNFPKPQYDKAKLLKRMKDYMEFAFDKANNYRGISSKRSVMHYVAWSWLAGDKEFSGQIQNEFENNYNAYGKDILCMICNHYSWDSMQWDDNVRRDNEP